ncbi:uncharacterized protein LOC129573342 [Sitodiplosis mosellana]|uniref:uncharacterized protein LOC129573342 n=1 Tax=Sitodiplosis mosellana TaxID=263140 RepID=UPI002443C958|nr:uncharacterized protein LOC129573342 [Sitodiplosis mosellana]
MTVLNFVVCFALLYGLCVAGIPGAPRPITDETKLTELRNSVTTHMSKLSGQQNGAQLEFIKIHTATSQTVAGSLYKIIAEINENNQIVNCTVSLWEKPWENFVKLDVECGEEPKRTYGWRSDQAETTTEQLPLRVFGGFSPLSEEALADLHPKVTESFTQLGKKHDDFDLIVKRILSGKSQVVAGTRYVLTVEATNPKDEVKTCEADIWEKTWENFFRVQLKCQEKDYEIHL